MLPDSISAQLVKRFEEFDRQGQRFARVLRESFDQAYDGVNTGRYRPDQLSKTESAHIGSLVEINLRRAFDGFINDGVFMDYMIDGHEVDCKYSKSPFGWMIPNETLGHHALVCHANDKTGYWHAGFVHISDSILTTGGNRDQKRTIKAAGRSAISWLWEEPGSKFELPPNTLLQLDEDVAEKIMSPKSGQQRINNLFRLNLGKRIPRGTVATVAMQKDYMKRLRYNGGARSALQKEGIVILGDYLYHRAIAARLHLPIPVSGDSVAVRLAPAATHEARPKVRIGTADWVVAGPSDPVVTAPRVPNVENGSKVEEAIIESF